MLWRGFCSREDPQAPSTSKLPMWLFTCFPLPCHPLLLRTPWPWWPPSVHQVALLPSVLLQRPLDWVKSATWSFSRHLVVWGLSPTPPPVIYIPGPRELLLAQYSPHKVPLRSPPGSG